MYFWCWNIKYWRQIGNDWHEWAVLIFLLPSNYCSLVGVLERAMQEELGQHFSSF